MLTRRHIRVKVLQSVYAYHQVASREMETQEKFLKYSLDQMADLYLLMLQLIVAVRDQAEEFMNRSSQKYFATDSEKNPSKTFIDNKIIAILKENDAFNEIITKKKLNYWYLDSDYVSIIFNELKEQDWYTAYLDMPKTSMADDREVVIRLFKEIIAPNEKLYDYLEDKRLTWVDDFPIVNTAIVRMLGKLSKKNVAETLIPELFKYDDDREFAVDLFRKAILNDQKLTEEIEGKTPNWDQDRIAEIDMIILKLGICEFLYFPSIPVRVTINEYLEIAKEYSTPKSSIFINGILDKVVKEFTTSNKMNKIGRGLQ